MDSRVKSFFSSVRGKKIALIGAGRSNLPLIEMFLKYGADVTVCDKKFNDKYIKQISHLEELGAKFKFGEDYLKGINAEIVFRTPGMPFYCDDLNELRKKGTTITSEMEVFFDICPAKIIAITGSDGKTTTTSIIANMLKKACKTVHVGGNIGKPLLPRIFEISGDDYVVAELSSFQLISMRKSPDIAVVTNLSPNHLDIHKNMDEYIEAKKNILIHQNAFSKTILNLDNNIVKSFSDYVRGMCLYFSKNHDFVKQNINGAYVSGDMLCVKQGNVVTPIVRKEEIKIPGAHNVENYLAAISTLWGLVTAPQMKSVAMSFGGVEHRMEFVKEINGVKYFNDAIATSPTRSISGTLSLYDKRIIMIAGGYDKNIPFDELGDEIAKKVKILILMGNTAEKIKQCVEKSKSYTESNINIRVVASMQEAVSLAYQTAKDGDIVSMSPACASFDMYVDFEAKGRHFKDLVNRL